MRSSSPPADTTETSFDLRLDAPCPTVSPESFEFTVPFGGGDGGDLTISNDGAGAYDFRIRERDRGRDIAAQGAGPRLAAPGEVEFSASGRGGPGVGVVGWARGRPACRGPAAAPAAPDWQTGAPVPAGIIRYAFATVRGQPGGVLRDLGRVQREHRQHQLPLRRGDGHVDDAGADPDRSGRAQRGLLRRPDLHDRRRRLQPALRLRHRRRTRGRPAAPVPRGAAMASAGAFDGKVFYIGGDNDFFPGSGVFNEVFIYDIASNSWSQGSPMPTATSGAGTAQAGEFLYVVGGWGAGAPGSNVNATQRYDMSADTWETGPAVHHRQGRLGPGGVRRGPVRDRWRQQRRRVLRRHGVGAPARPGRLAGRVVGGSR